MQPISALTVQCCAGVQQISSTLGPDASQHPDVTRVLESVMALATLCQTVSSALGSSWSVPDWLPPFQVNMHSLP